MSGDVQPRKRKDKKKKKDELGIEEPRGTAAALGEGDVFMHSYSDHGTGGHWCAKVIFFSLLAVLVTLIGLIILENRGLSELEANAVESRYSNILEGWLEDAPDDDHHDEHTLELKHHDNDEEDDHYGSHNVDDHDEDHEDEDEHGDNDEEHGDDDEDEHADEDENELEDEAKHADEDEDEHTDEDEDEHDDEETQEDDDEQNDEEDSQQELEEADDEDQDDRSPYKYYAQDDDEDETAENDDNEDEEEPDTAHNEDEDDRNVDDESNEDLDNEDEDLEERNVEGDEDEESNENDDYEEDNLTGEDEEEHEDHEDDANDVEVEKIEREASEEEPINIGLPALPEENDDDDKDDDHDEADDDDEDAADEADDEDTADDDFLEAEVPPVVETVTAPSGKPFKEVEEDDVSTETPPDTLEEEEEYEKQQEEKRKEEEQSSHHIWLKLSVGAALLVATHAVLRRATAPRDEAEEEHVVREETPVVDRRMTLIPEQAAPPVIPKKEIERPVVEEIVRQAAPVVKAAPVLAQQESEEEEVEEPELEDVVEEEVEEDEPEQLEAPKKEAEKEDKELYSDDEEEEVVAPKKEAPKAAEPAKPAPEPEDDDDDVEIIDEEQLEEELEEEEEVSDVDDTELLSRLEAKYGKLPEPERPGQRHKDGGNSVEDAWPGEPADAYWRQQLDSAERELRQGAWSAAAERAGAAELRPSGRARRVLALALDRLAEARRDNGLLARAIAAYFDLLKMSDHLSDKKLLQVAHRTLDRIQFLGNYLKAEPVYRLLIRRFPSEPGYRNNLTISFLMANRNDLAENSLKETLALWPEDRVALAHYAFVLKTSHKDRLEEAVELFRKALEGDKGPACEPRFYYHYGDALLLLGRFEEAHEVHKRGAKLGHFLSASQRSLYNVPRLKSRPWWNVDETPYRALARNLEKRWKEILKEGQRAAKLFEEEQEGLRERGEWSQMDLFVRGREVAGRCAGAPVTCAAVRAEPAAAGCRRGQVKFSSMAPGTHVRAHVGPTNCRLRMHLALSNTTGTFLRVDKETRQWQVGKVLLFDDSFEHEVWHNGTGARLVLIVDVWHPDLSPAERRALPPI